MSEVLEDLGGQPYLHLRLPLLGDVLDRAHHARRPAVRAEPHFGPCVDDAHRTVGAHDAVVDAVKGVFVKSPVDCVLHLAAVVRMHRAYKILVSGDKPARIRAEKAVHLVGPESLVAVDVPIPVAQAGDALGFGEAVGYLAQPLDVAGQTRLHVAGGGEHPAQFIPIPHLDRRLIVALADALAAGGGLRQRYGDAADDIAQQTSHQGEDERGTAQAQVPLPGKPLAPGGQFAVQRRHHRIVEPGDPVHGRSRRVEKVLSPDADGLRINQLAIHHLKKTLHRLGHALDIVPPARPQLRPRNNPSQDGRALPAWLAGGLRSGIGETGGRIRLYGDMANGGLILLFQEKCAIADERVRPLLRSHLAE